MCVRVCACVCVCVRVCACVCARMTLYLQYSFSPTGSGLVGSESSYTTWGDRCGRGMGWVCIHVGIHGCIRACVYVCVKARTSSLALTTGTASSLAALVFLTATAP